MKYVIPQGTTSVEYGSPSHWEEYDEVVVEEPSDWYIHYIMGGFVTMFDYCQSTGRGDYYQEYVEDEHTDPVAFTDDPKHNAQVIKSRTFEPNHHAAFVRKPKD